MLVTEICYFFNFFFKFGDLTQLVQFWIELNLIGLNCLFCIDLEATVSLPRVEIKPSSMAALVGDTIALRCFAHLQQDSPIHMRWSSPAKVGSLWCWKYVDTICF